MGDVKVPILHAIFGMKTQQIADDDMTSWVRATD